MKKIAAVCILLNLVAGCLLNAKAQNTTPPSTYFTVGEHHYLGWSAPHQGHYYRLVITTPQNEIVHDLCCITAIYASMYNRTVVVEDTELGEYIIKMPPAAKIHVITELNTLKEK